MRAPQDPLAPDDVIGGYSLLRRIGKGGMAEVWVARRAGRTGKYVAVKVIAPHLAGQERYSRMFKAEAELSAMLSHSNIVQVFDEGEDDGISYLVMEWVDGINLVRLREALKFVDDDALRWSIIAFVIGQLLHALSYAHSVTTTEGHELGIVHRDVSPQNVLISNSGDVKLTDFGIAHTVIEESSHLHVKGKLRYMSPEQLAGKTKEPTIDLYAVGAILHEMLEAEKFRGEFDDERVLHAQVLGGVIPELSKPCPPELDAVRRGLLEPDETKRLQSADKALELLRGYVGYRDMRMELTKICGSLTGVVRPRTGPGTPRPGRRPPSARATPGPSRATPAPSRVTPAPSSVPTRPDRGAPSDPLPPAPAFQAAPADALPESTVLMPELHGEGGSPRLTPPTEQTAYLPGGGLPNAATPPPAIAQPGTALLPPPTPAEEPTATSQHAMAVSPGPDDWSDEQAHPEATAHTRFEVKQRRSPLTLIAGLGIAAVLGGGATAWVLTSGMSGDEREPVVGQVDGPSQAAPPTEPPPPAAAEPARLAEPEPEAPVIPTAQPEAQAEAEAEAEPEPEPEPEPKPKPEPEPEPASSKPEPEPEPARSASKPAPTPSKPKCNEAEGGDKVLVHFRLDGVDAAKVKVQGQTVTVKAGSSKRLTPGRFAVRYRTEGGWRSGGCQHFKPGGEYVIAVSAKGAKLYTFKEFVSR